LIPLYGAPAEPVRGEPGSTAVPTASACDDGRVPGDNDDALVERLRNGDAEAVRELYRRYAGAVLTVARAYVSDAGAAEEVVQQTFLNAWRAAARLGSGRPVSPWLYQIARRCAVDAIRRDARQSASFRGDPTVPAADDPATEFERSWQGFEVRRALDALPPAERDTVRLAHVEGLTHAEIAGRLDVPIGTVKSRLGRAYRRLETALHHLAPANRADGVGVLQEEG
jgi:RNA polymerase sigma-70 factor (ECF subfamily)